MRGLPILFSFLLLAGLLAAQSNPSNISSTGSVDAQGGYITPVSFSLNQTSDHWSVFYGDVNSTPGSNYTLVLNSYVFSNASDATRLLHLYQTQGYYLIADSPSPAWSNLTAPDLDALDARYSIDSAQSARLVFSDSSNFSFGASTTVPSSSLTLPTMYMNGYTNGSLNASAYREGVAQSNDSFIFVVPIIRHGVGFDNRTHDFEFALPYTSMFSSNTFYAFSVVAPTPPTTPPLHSLNWRWSYDGQTLVVSTRPGAVVSISGLGYSSTETADSSGKAKFNNVPAGSYFILITLDDYETVSDLLYLPAQEPPSPPTTPSSPSMPLPPGVFLPGGPNGPVVTVQNTPQGTVVCVDAECYLTPLNGAEQLQLLTDLSCTGSICHFSGINQTAFIQKYNLKPARGVIYNPPLLSQGPLINLTAALNALAPGLGDRFGAAVGSGPSGFYVAAFLIVSFAAIAAISFFKPRPMRPTGGYD